MRLPKKDHIIYLLILAGITLIFLNIEYYLHSKDKKKDHEAYQLSNYTHDGKPWATPALHDPYWTNPYCLKFALAPYTIYKNAPNQKTPSFTTNSMGFRGSREFSSVSKRNKRIIVVGGSAAFGHGLPNDRETFQEQLENLNRKYEVINAGVGGYHSGQELAYVVTELVDYHPDVIIAFDGFNDLFWNWYADKYSDRLQKPGELGYSYNYFSNVENYLIDGYQNQTSLFNSFRRFFNILISRSIVLSTIQTKITRASQKNHIVTKASGDEVSDKSKNEYFGNLLNTYTANLIKMHDFCQSQRIKFVVVFQPELGLKSTKTPEELHYLQFWPRVWNVENYESTFPSLYKQFIVQAKIILAKKGIDFIDINDYPEYKNSPQTLFLDFIHPNKNGHGAVASIINENLEKL